MKLLLRDVMYVGSIMYGIQEADGHGRRGSDCKWFQFPTSYRTLRVSPLFFWRREYVFSVYHIALDTDILTTVAMD